jgi:hypothetical protein
MSILLIIGGAPVTSGAAFSAGTGSASALGASLVAAFAESTGTSTATGASASLVAAVASSIGTATAIAGGSTVVAADAFASGISDVQAVGEAIGGEVPIVVVIPTVPAGGGVRNPWKTRKEHKRREIELEEDELLLIAGAAVRQLARDHMNRQAMR